MAVRSPITQAILAQSLQPFPNQVFSAGEGAARAASKILSAVIAKKLMKQEAADRAEGIESVVASVFPQPQVTANQAPSAVPGATVDAGQLDQFQNVRPVVQNLLSSDNPQLQAIGGNMIAQVLSDRIGSQDGFRILTPEEEMSILGEDLPGTFGGSFRGNQLVGEPKRIEGSEPGDFIVMERGDRQVTVRKNSPEADKLSKQGFNLKKTPAAQVNIEGDRFTPGQKAVDEAFAKEYVGFIAGGFADVNKQLQQLDESLGILETAEAEGRNITGLVGILPDFAQPFVNKDGTIAREAIEEVVQRNLRVVLGAQFTEKEGERLISRAFNPKLPPAENAKRLRRLINQINEMARAKLAMSEYFRNNGTLVGYDGPMPSIVELSNIDFGPGEKPSTPSPEKPSTSPPESDIVFRFDENGNLVRK